MIARFIFFRSPIGLLDIDSESEGGAGAGGDGGIQELNETVGGKLTEFITQINNCCKYQPRTTAYGNGIVANVMTTVYADPPEIVEYYSPNYSKKLLEKVMILSANHFLEPQCV